MRNPWGTFFVSVRPVGWLVSCLLLSVCTSGTMGQTPVRVLESPLRIAASQIGEVVTSLSLDDVAYRNLKAQAEVRITGFSLGVERKVDLDLKRIDAFTPGARIVLVTAGGEIPLPKPDVLLLAGTVVGRADSSVFLSMSPHGTRGWIEFGGDRFVISSGPGPDKTKPVVYDYNAALAANQIKWMDPWTCAVDNLKIPAGAMPVQRAALGASSSAASGSGVAVYDAQVAVETDFEFTNNLFGGNPDAAAAYVATIFGAASEIYTRDVGTRLSVNFLRLWETSNDPWTAGGTRAQLFQFRDYWNANETHVFRHVTHFLSGRGLGGGIAWLDAVCVTGLNYALSANLRGFFPLPLQNNHSSNWDIMVVTHEFGHNFGSVHTHDMVPPADGCGNGDCSAASLGTIMSYCHQCSPGMSNIALRFHERVIFEQILPFLQFQISCDIGVGPAAVFAQPTDVTACSSGIVRLSVGAGGTSPIQMQWRKDGVDVAGATSAILTLDPLSPSDAGIYDVMVSNAEGSSTSDPAVLAVVDCGPPNASSAGCRALRLAPEELGLSAPVAFQVSSSAAPCLNSYVRIDGVLDDEPAFQPAGDWADMVLVGPKIIPDTLYEVYMDYGAVGDPRLTSAAIVRTAPWGDVAGENVDGVWGAPDGAVVVGDILAGIACFVNAPGAPPLERCDIYPAAPDGEVQIVDVLQVVAGFQGLPYPFAPPGCP